MPTCYTESQAWLHCATLFHIFIAVIAIIALVGVVATYREVRRLRMILEHKKEMAREWIAKLEGKHEEHKRS